MAGRRLASAALLTLLLAVAVAPLSSAVRPVSDAHRSAAAELFAPSADGSFGDLESTYEAVRTFHILGLDKDKSLTGKVCKFAAEKLASPASSLAKDLFHAVRISGALGCSVDPGVYNGVVARFKAVIKDTNSLLEFYYSVGGLLSIKEQGNNVILSDAESTFHAIKALSQSDGRWRYDTNSAESSTFAAGIALEALAGVVSLADAEVDPSMIGVVKNNIVKLFDTIKSYDDGTFYFDEKHVDANEYKGPITTSASVVRGVVSFGSVASGKLDIPGDKILGLAKFFLNIGLPGSSKDCFNQIEALSILENNRLFVPLILSLPSKVFSLTSKDQLKVEVTTVFGSAAPPLKVNLVQVLGSDSKVITSENKELQFDHDNNVHYLDIAPLKIDVGKYSLVFEISLQEPEHETAYATGGRNTENVFVTGVIKVDKAEIGISDNDAGAVESVQKLDLLKDTKVSLSANHLQKLRLSFQLTTPLGKTFKPHQVFLKLKHESKVEHLFVVPGSARQFKIVLVEYHPHPLLQFTLLVFSVIVLCSLNHDANRTNKDFLGLVEKLYYLSGRYDLELAVGDAVMRPQKKPHAHLHKLLTRSLQIWAKGRDITHIPCAREEATQGTLACIHESYTSAFYRILNRGPAAFASLFHAGIGAVLLLYVLFWVKLDLFTTLKYLGFLGIILVFVGHRALSYLSSASAKQKTA
ncbi:hypothetical protein PR202_ga08549 [Eleusine coracana subsp. coracana]|uniref:Dolichyl-diphosphooligosaccharide--protein glycosyltransferase subunit 2 n=1 Tax=Eleusine coracana subsp. coracana TaxID=191504 RepID=A0AAV5C321_ELECO|nr:hypothetical protein PR202_ga08549 [Eleusine coracana subsp. coracana]